MAYGKTDNCVSQILNQCEEFKIYLKLSNNKKKNQKHPILIIPKVVKGKYIFM